MDSAAARAYGRGAALLGALTLAVSLWLPWYELRIPSGLLDRLDALGAQSGALGGYLRAGVSALRARGPLEVTAWRAFESLDAVLLVLAVVAALVAAGALGGRALAAPVEDGAALAVLGAVASTIVVYRMVDRPAPDEVLALATGSWVALAGAGAMLAGGLATRVPAGRTAPATSQDPLVAAQAGARPVTPTGMAASGSVPPPGRPPASG